jgi:hypothetical protein
MQKIEGLRDRQAHDDAKRALAEGEELVPSEVTYTILDGEHPICAWRRYRDLTQQVLAGAAGISVPYLSHIETVQRQGSTDVLALLANTLDITLEDIVAS